MEYESIIGLEIHMQLKSKTKMFCACPLPPDKAAPNTFVCPICMGHPGTLPVPHTEAIRLGLTAATILHCTIPTISKFDRKHYFYPDLAKGYQISQYDQPIGTRGWVHIGNKKIRMHRIHLEEDVAKNIHRDGETLCDFNRSGIPLAEMVTEPDLRTPEDAKLFLQELRALMRTAGVSDADMEKGHMRCDANISLRPVGDKKLYPKIELKNINSFRFVERALTFEIKRQMALWEQGTPPMTHETRGWNETKGESVLQRTKEEAHDYRYFPEPDIPPFAARRLARGITIPELPPEKRERFVREYCFAPQDAAFLAGDEAWAAFAEETMSELREWVGTAGAPDSCDALGKLAGAWMTSKLQELLHMNGTDIAIAKVTPENFAELITLFYTNKINSTNAQKILQEMLVAGADPTHIMEDKKLGLVADKTLIRSVVARVIAAYPAQAAECKSGKTALMGFFVGKVMKETEGAADPVLTQELIREALSL